MGVGLVVPGHIACDAHGSVSFAWRRGCAAEPEALQFARMIGGAAFEAADSIANPDRVNIGPRLTNRQRQCLIRAAQGNPIWRIGRHLELSPDHVRAHLRTARQPYGANGGPMLAVRALYGGDSSFVAPARRSK